MMSNKYYINHYHYLKLALNLHQDVDLLENMNSYSPERA